MKRECTTNDLETLVNNKGATDSIMVNWIYYDCVINFGNSGFEYVFELFVNSLNGEKNLYILLETREENMKWLTVEIIRWESLD